MPTATALAWPIALLATALLAAALLVLAALAFASFGLERAVRSRRIGSLASLEAAVRPALIVALGCPPRTRDGRPSAYLVGRARAAAAAFHQLGSVPILCSGRVEPPKPGDAAGSDEAEALALLLEAAGVPMTAILFDRRAQRTLDTIDHLAERHPSDRILLVTQPFHLPRALFLARARGLDAWGLAAPGPTPGWRGRLREGLGGLRAVWDVGVAVRGR